jgi:hypothetical protein
VSTGEPEHRSERRRASRGPLDAAGARLCARLAENSRAGGDLEAALLVVLAAVRTTSPDVVSAALRWSGERAATSEELAHVHATLRLVTRTGLFGTAASSTSAA